MIRLVVAIVLALVASTAFAGTTENTSKLNGYGVLLSTGEGASKINGYAVLCCAGPGLSKLNAYAVLSPVPTGMPGSLPMIGFGQ